MVIKPCIAYNYYVAPFSKPNICKLEKNTHKSHKNNMQCSQQHIKYPHTPITEDFGINTTSLLPKYINCIWKELIHALNNQEQLGQIHQGLTKIIAAKCGGARHLPTLTYHACNWSPIVRTIFLLNNEYDRHIDTSIRDFPIQQTKLEQNWCTTPEYQWFP